MLRLTEIRNELLKSGANPEQMSVTEWLDRLSEYSEKVSNLEKQIAEKTESHSKYKSLFEMSDDALLVIENYTFVDCNQAVVKMLGYESREELLNTHPSQLSPEFQPCGKPSYIKAQEMMELALVNGSNHFEWIHTRANGENFPVEVWLSKVEFGDRVLLNTIWRDLTLKKRAEQIIRKSIEEKEILLKEIHHRVKNNLQIITSLINLQVAGVANENARHVLLQSKSRIESMCKVHEMLYGSRNFSSIDYGLYLRELLQQLLVNTPGGGGKVTTDIRVENLFLNINTAIPLGLIVNEMVTNSLKYAFPKGRDGIISIFIVPTHQKGFRLTYSDNGVGYDVDLNMAMSNSLGFQLIYSLCEQLNGTLLRDTNKPGTHYRMDFEMV
jgi:PAS domain S-box-containing protein